MPRLEAKIRVSIKFRDTGKLYRIELIEKPWPGHYWLRCNGKNSTKIQDITISQLADKIRTILVNHKRGKI